MPDRLTSNLNFDFAPIRNALVNFIVPIISLVVSALMFVLVIYPSIGKIPMLKQDLVTQTQLRDVLASKLTVIDKLVDFKSVVDENSTLIATVVPPKEYVPGLLEQLDVTASSSGLVVNRLSYSFGESPSNDGGEEAIDYKTVLVSLSAEGNYDQLISFLENVEKSARFINVISFRFGTIDSSSTSAYSFTFTFSAPYIDVQSNAVTDDPVTLDITSTEFINMINKVKTFRVFEADISTSEAPQAVQETPEEVLETSASETEVPEL